MASPLHQPPTIKVVNLKGTISLGLQIRLRLFWDFGFRKTTVHLQRELLHDELVFGVWSEDLALKVSLEVRVSNFWLRQPNPDSFLKLIIGI